MKDPLGLMKAGTPHTFNLTDAQLDCTLNPLGLKDHDR